MNDLKRVYARYQVELEATVLATLRSGRWINGARVNSFSANFAKALGVSECIPVANGTDALELALRAVRNIRAPAGREVITAANAGGYTTTACLQIGLIPVYVDVEARTQCVALESVVSALGDQTMAVVATHLYGVVVDIPALRMALQEAGYAHVAIVEDCAQAHGACLNGTMAGSMGDIAAFSFYPSKNLGAMGDAGAVVTSDTALADAVRTLRQYGWASKYQVSAAGGRNSRMDEIQAAVLDTMLPRISGLNAERARIHDRLRAAGRSLRFVEHGQGGVIHLAVAMSRQRDAFRRFLAEQGIESDIHYPVLDCDQAGWTGASKRVAPQGLSVARQSVNEIVTLPCFPGMTEEELHALCNALEGWTE